MTANRPAVPPAFVREGIALFNRGAFFEAHERIEEAWRAAEGPDRPVYQALVQIAAACVHLERGNRRGARKLLDRARRNLAGADLPGWLDAGELRRTLEIVEDATARGALDERARPRILIAPRNP